MPDAAEGPGAPEAPEVMDRGAPPAADGVEAVRRHLGMGPDDLLGEGDESLVYALGEAHVAKIHRQAGAELLERRRVFYAALSARPLPVAVPFIETIGSCADTWYTVERRLPGRSLGPLLPQLAWAERRRALFAFLDAAQRLTEVDVWRLIADPAQPYGDVLAGEPLRAATWPAFLLAKADQRLERAAAGLAAAGIDPDTLRASFARALGDLPTRPPPCLVHGDYWPPNVFVDDTLSVTAIVDFGSLTVIGDHLQDIASALVFAEDRPGVDGGDVAALRQRARGRYGAAVDHAEHVYRGYYGILFSVHQRTNPRAYAWAAHAIRAFLGAA